ncbi:MAG: hypothetical protein H0T52_10125 [Lautropia sp.]|nr:hypothetical protein [Lautropia sp.]
MNPSTLRAVVLLRHAAAAAVAFHLAAAPASAAGQRPRSHEGSGAAATVLNKPEVGQSKNTGPSHVVNEGDAERPLWIDTSRVAEFSMPGTDQPAIRAAEPGEVGESSRISKPDPKSGPMLQQATPAAGGASAAVATQVSPIFLDASGRPRALPGGVIVALKQAMPEAQARDALQAAGLTPQRQIGERMWLVESPVGIESLNLANRLHAEGRFEFVQPNWWHPRTTK